MCASGHSAYVRACAHRLEPFELRLEMLPEFVSLERARACVRLCACVPVRDCLRARARVSVCACVRLCAIVCDCVCECK